MLVLFINLLASNVFLWQPLLKLAADNLISPRGVLHQGRVFSLLAALQCHLFLDVVNLDVISDYVIHHK